MHFRVPAASQRLTGRARAGVFVLVASSVLLLGVIVWMFVGLGERSASVAQSVREDAVWAAFQTDREVGRFIESLEEARRTGNAGDVVLRFDLLYSRLDVLGRGDFAISLNGGSEVAELARAVEQQISALTPTIDGISAEPQIFITAASDLLTRARALRDLTGKLATASNAAVNQSRVQDRGDALATYWKIGATVAALVVVFAIILVLMATQLRQILRAQSELALLSEKHARAAEAAEAGSRAKSTFLATMSHEIRTPLNGIIGMTEFLAESGLSPEHAEKVSIIRRSGDVLLDVINDVLDYSKLEAGSMDLHRAQFALPDLVASLDAVMRPRARAAGLEFTLNLPRLLVTTDAARLRQVLINLIGNAIKFTPNGSVAVDATLVGGAMEFTVTDTGVGIPQDSIGKLFEEFRQLDSSSTRRFGGTGLGLAICKQLVGLLGGSITVVSREGIGSRFAFTIPVDPVRELPEESAAPAPVARLRLSGCVLVVEDNAINRQVATGLLERAGLEVVVAEDGASGLALMRDRSFDAVLMDMQMPIMDGLEATRQARGLGITTPIIGLTANAFVDDRNACLAAGMNDFLAKPITRERLLAALQLHLGPGSPAEQTAPRISEDYQRNLIDEIGQELFDQLMLQFNTDSGPMLEAAREAYKSGDVTVYDQRLHTLKGAAATLGLTRIAKLAQELRTAPSPTKLNGLAAELTEVRRAA